MSEVDLAGLGLSIIDMVLSMCQTIYKMSQNVKANKERCQQVAERVRALEDLVLTIKRYQISSSVYKALKELHTTMESAKTLITKFSKTKAFAGFMRSSSLKDKFHEVDKKLSDHLHILSGALLIDQGKVIHKVYKTVRGQKLPASSPSSPAPSIMSPSEIYSPPSMTRVPSIMSPSQIYSPPSMTHVPSIMSPSEIYSQPSMTYVPCIMPSMQMYGSMPYMTPMSLPGAMAPYSVTTTRIVTGKSAMLSPTDIPSTLANLFSK